MEMLHNPRRALGRTVDLRPLTTMTQAQVVSCEGQFAPCAKVSVHYYLELMHVGVSRGVLRCPDYAICVSGRMFSNFLVSQG